jgi:hypothetical protein
MAANKDTFLSVISDKGRFCLTKKAEPPPTRGVNRDSGTDRANGGWLRRLVRHQRREIHNKIRQIQMLANWQAAALARRINRRELNPD